MSFGVLLLSVGGSTTGDDSTLREMSEGALACLEALLSDSFFFCCVRKKYITNDYACSKVGWNLTVFCSVVLVN